MDDTISKAERLEFMQLMLDPACEERIKSLIDDQFHGDIATAKLDELRSQNVLSSILKAKMQPAKTRRITYSKTWWAAAAAIGILATGALYILNNYSPGPSLAQKSSLKSNDIAAPSAARALLKLSDGREVYIDDMANGVLATDGKTDIKKLESGELIYDGHISNSLTYNTLEVPLGSKPVSIGFSDKSKVWLNAGSSIKFPVSFVGKERVVDITGEVYFEITKDASKPFVVKAGNAKVLVLGTDFNVNAYDDEPALNVTLLNGSVQVSNPSGKVLLKPGNKAIVSNDIKISAKADINEVMAWKNGFFQFEETSIHAIMRQLSRAYNITYEIRGAIKETFGGSISRNVNLSQVLKMLELTGMVNFEIQGTKIIVSPG